MSYSSIIFDLDGTLLDTLQGIAETANTTLVRHNFPVHPQKDYMQFVGDGLSVLIERITPQGTEQYLRENCRQMFLQLYAENWQKNCRPYPGIDELLTAVVKKSITISVLSNKPHAFTQLFVNRYFPAVPFSQIYGQREGVAKKPDPTVALQIARQQKLLPEKMLFVGDTAIDIRTGKAAAMATAAVTWGFRGIDELQAEKPDILVNTPMDLLQYV